MFSMLDSVVKVDQMISHTEEAGVKSRIKGTSVSPSPKT